MADARPRWFGALEGYYGEPYTHEARVALVRWLGEQGFTTYSYAPKGDPLQRDRWREPYPADQLDRFRELVQVGRSVGVDVSFVVSPGLDWAGTPEDHAALAAKLQGFYDLGCRHLGVAFDDVAPGGADLGTAHGEAVAAAVAALPDDVAWAACPTDYAISRATAYVSALHAAMPLEVDLMWTGPAIVSPTITAGDVRGLAADLPGRRLVLADNVPVNDGPMSGVLHLGPFPARDPEVVELVSGFLVNAMALPLASRVGIACAGRWWQDPTGDREQHWREVVASIPGLGPLAKANRSWLTDPGPDAELLEWTAALPAGDRRLLDWLAAGPRQGLEPEWVAELEPWLQAWEWEALAMAFVIYGVAAVGERPAEVAFGVGELSRRLRLLEQQSFGIRHAFYGVTRQEGERIVPDLRGLVLGANLTDLICQQALAMACGTVGS